MTTCPLPDGHAPRLVGPRIESALEKSGQWRCRRGPLFITAVGNLTQIPGGDESLRTLSSTGIALKHAHDIQRDLFEWTDENLAPATIMLITSSKDLKTLASTLYDIEKKGYRILLAYPPRALALRLSILKDVPEELFWDSLMADAAMEDNKQEQQDLFFRTTSAVKPVKLPCFAQNAILVPKALKISPRISRVKNMRILEASHNNVDRLDPANMVLGRSKASFNISSQEWDLLVTQDIAYHTSSPLTLKATLTLDLLTLVDAKTFKELCKMLEFDGKTCNKGNGSTMVKIRPEEGNPCFTSVTMEEFMMMMRKLKTEEAAVEEENPEKPIQPIQVQRSSATEQEDKPVSSVAKRASRKSISSCSSQDTILTNRLKCLEDEDKM
ncbi:putative NYN domain, limkain-b1-type, meiosis regulator and mRNA stability factor 1 [Arabidopsis thaliana]